ncbi:hypothetical protein IFM89_022160 [Coptis chinensis]|uniref:Uncharacterized protein n=1 Tax=Coptis chinensis TaxID=261450 RepID=A0A835HWH7_9MAGN|nr:hypothetical protein IFM89_022160 [Coptis chinensis]
MKSYGEQRSWTKEYFFRIDSYSEPFEAIDVMKYGEILFLYACRLLGYYNTEMNYYRFIDLEETIPEKRFVSQAAVHVGSLISPRKIGGLTKSVAGKGEHSKRREDTEEQEY